MFLIIYNIKWIIKKDGTDINWHDTVEFTFPITGGRVIKVYIAAKLPFTDSPLYRVAVRLSGINTPEIKGKGVSDEEKEMAKQARDFLAAKILNKYVYLKNIETEKYGRVLADVWLNELLLTEGGAKINPISWKKYKEEI